MIPARHYVMPPVPYRSTPASPSSPQLEPSAPSSPDPVHSKGELQPCQASLAGEWVSLDIGLPSGARFGPEHLKLLAAFPELSRSHPTANEAKAGGLKVRTQAIKDAAAANLAWHEALELERNTRAARDAAFARLQAMTLPGDDLPIRKERPAHLKGVIFKVGQGDA